MPSKATQVFSRMDDAEIAALDALAAHVARRTGLDVTRADVLRLAARRLAEAEGLSWPEAQLTRSGNTKPKKPAKEEGPKRGRGRPPKEKPKEKPKE